MFVFVSLLIFCGSYIFGCSVWMVVSGNNLDLVGIIRGQK